MTEKRSCPKGQGQGVVNPLSQSIPVTMCHVFPPSSPLHRPTARQFQHDKTSSHPLNLELSYQSCLIIVSLLAS